MKKIGFLSFGHWSDSYGSQVRSAADSLLQSIELAVAAEELGADGAYFRVHHFARQLGSPFPLLSAIGARTRTIEIGTAVIDMRYENPLYMAEDAGAADLIARKRLQLGISRGSPEQVIDGWRQFGYTTADGESDGDMARRHTLAFLEVLKGEGFAKPNPRPMFPNPPGLLRVEPHSEGLRDRIWWGSSSNATARWAAQLGMNLQSSTLKDDESGEPLHIQQRKQIEAYREAWKDAGHRRTPRRYRQPPEPRTSPGHDLVDAACKHVPRNLSDQEWHRYIGAEPYRPTCSGLPSPVPQSAKRHRAGRSGSARRSAGSDGSPGIRPPTAGRRPRAAPSSRRAP